ncbi:MAG TPA: hypothetical protein VFA45_12435 [Actinomycetes bacterium]|jgi:DNA invertase Pin-like site-specific DNA recombinase|nr:hypothetical protein [Actinomycetes bacterium]
MQVALYVRVSADRQQAQTIEQQVTQIRGAVAEYERTLIADRMRRGRLARLAAGSCCP